MIEAEARTRESQAPGHEGWHSFVGADSLLKAAGTAEYTPDVRLPHLLHGKVLRSAHAHARIVRIDVEAARRLLGVKAILTAADLPRSARNGRVLAEGRVLHYGDAVALVAATSEGIAGNLCRCTGYVKIVGAIRAVAAETGGRA